MAEVLPSERTDDVLAQSGLVLRLLPAMPDTENLMDARRLGRTKPGARLLDVGRGRSVVADFVAAVQERVIAGAVLDAFRQEPLPSDHPFWTTEGITVLPHIGGLHPQRDAIVARLFADNLGRFLDGRPLLQEVDRATVASRQGHSELRSLGGLPFEPDGARGPRGVEGRVLVSGWIAGPSHTGRNRDG